MHIQSKGSKNKAPSEAQKRRKHRVEYVFAGLEQLSGNTLCPID